MTDSLNRSGLAKKDSLQNSPGITEADVLLTEVLASRSARPPDLAAENQALRTLAQHLMDEPQVMLKTLVRLALDLCRADTVGVSLLETTPIGESIFRWVAIAGAWESLEQGTTPGNFSPCGTTLACNQPQLYSYPERFFTYLYHPQFPVVEELLIPLHVNNRPIGTLWIIFHTEARRFDAEDQRLMMSLGSFTASALYSLQQLQQTAATALRQSEEKSRNILESITEAFFALDENWQFTYVNQAAEALLDRAPGDLVGKNFCEEYPGLIGSEFERFYEGVIRDRVAGALTAFYPDHNRWYEVRTFPATNGITIYSRDVTGQIQAEATLRESEEKSRNILESIAESFFALDQDWRFTYINRSGEALLDRLPGDLIGKNFWEEYPGLIGNELEPFYRSAMRDRVAGSLTAFYPDHDRWYEVRTYPAANGIAVYFNNVTAQIQAKEASRLSEARFRRIFESKMIGMGIWARAGGIIDANDTLLALIGYTRQDLESGLLNWQKITPLEQRWLDEQALAEIALFGTCASYEKEFIHKQGQRIPILVSAEAFADATDTGVFFTIDLTERKAAEAEREKLLQQEQAARAAAEQANRIKDEFLAVLSHELRSPLNPILGWSQLLQRGKLDAAKTQFALQTIERNAHLQAELIEDLLDVSRILQGKLNLNVRSINLVSIIPAAMETVRLAAEARSIQVEVNLEPEVGLVWGDSTRLQQVIWNLLSNAVKFTPVGGQVNIRLERLDSCAQITVSDTGQGIEANFLPYVFDYFRQSDATTTRKFGGLGLGLAIVQNLVELHGGTVRVKSPGSGMGATFTVKLPLMPIQIVALQKSQPSEFASDLNGIQVLVVDDEPDSREFVAFVLEQAGAKVMTATTAAEALTMLIRSKPTVLLSDIGMPDMDGYMLMKQVRALPPEQGGKVPAIALTAYAGDFNQQQVLQAGFQQHVSKPVEPEKLVRAIAHLLNHT